MDGRPGRGPAYVVLDTNVIAAWSFEEDDTASATEVRTLAESGRVEAIVPELFWAEFQHVCMKKMTLAPPLTPLSPSVVNAVYEETQALGLIEIPVLHELREAAWQLILSYSLGSYDAYFLALAAELGVEVWTLDKESFHDRVAADAAYGPLVRLVGVHVP